MFALTACNKPQEGNTPITIRRKNGTSDWHFYIDKAEALIYNNKYNADQRRLPHENEVFPTYPGILDQLPVIKTKQKGICCFMNCFTVDLYAMCGEPRPQGGAGYLSCYLQPAQTADGTPLRRPAVLVIPGGGYGHVSAREGEPIALRMLGYGYCAFVLDYSIEPIRFPTALREAAMAMRYIRSHADEFGIGHDMVAAVGFSAGGHLCGTLGMLYDSPQVQDLGAAQTLRPDALGLCYSVSISYPPTHVGSFDNLCGDDAALRRRLSLDRLVRPDMPAVYLWHTRDDDCVPCLGTLILAQKLVEAGVDCALHLYRHGHHGLATADIQSNTRDALRHISSDIPNWIGEFACFLEEKGFGVKDAR